MVALHGLRAACSQQLCSAGLMFSPLSPRVLDATVCSYLTWAPAVRACTVNTIAHELYSCECGGPTARAGRRKQRYFLTYKYNKVKYSLTLTVTSDKGGGDSERSEFSLLLMGVYGGLRSTMVVGCPRGFI